MKTAELKVIIDKHTTSLADFEAIWGAVNKYMQSHPSPMSVEQVFPSWEDATKGITDSRFTELPDKNTIRQGARIMYDMLYVMIKSTTPTASLSAEQVDELGEKHADKYYKNGSEEMIHIVEHLAWVNRKYNFIEGYNAASTPSVTVNK